MEKIIEDLENDLRSIIEGKPLKPIRKNLGDSVNIRFLRMVVFSLQWASVGYQSALRFAGMKFGRRIGEDSEKTELSLILDEIKKIIEALWEGKVQIGIMPELDTVEFRVYESALATGVSNISQSLCLFEEGFIEGYLDGVISKARSIVLAKGERGITKISVEEKKCFGLGDKYCSFLIRF